MKLNVQNMQDLAAHIRANADPVVANALALRADNQIADWYNGLSAFIVWRTQTSTRNVFNAIDWAKFTPADAVPADALGNAVFTSRILVCQTKQINVQTALMGALQVDSRFANIRKLFDDALKQIPAGVSGALLNAGAAAVQTAMQRAARWIETIYASGTGSAQNPGDLGANEFNVLDGAVSVDQVSYALNGLYDRG